jgi:hypothetical protein
MSYRMKLTSQMLSSSSRIPTWYLEKRSELLAGYGTLRSGLGFQRGLGPTISISWRPRGGGQFGKGANPGILDSNFLLYATLRTTDNARWQCCLDFIEQQKRNEVENFRVVFERVSPSRRATESGTVVEMVVASRTNWAFNARKQKGP